MDIQAPEYDGWLTRGARLRTGAGEWDGDIWLTPPLEDVVGYSRLAGSDEERTLARLRALRSDLIDPTIAVHHGRSSSAPATGASLSPQRGRCRSLRDRGAERHGRT
jgi:class 3 adenylate cyclase